MKFSLKEPAEMNSGPMPSTGIEAMLYSLTVESMPDALVGVYVVSAGSI